MSPGDRSCTTLMGVPSSRQELRARAAVRPARVLIVEDNAVNQMLVRRQLTRLGHDHVVVDHAEDALALLADGEHGFDLVLMDRQLPDIDGLEATRRLRVLEANGRHVPVVAVTASALTDDRMECMAAGMDDFLAKPVSLAELSAVVEHWTGLAR